MSMRNLCDSITRIRNGVMAKNLKVNVHKFKLMYGVLDVLKQMGCIKSYSSIDSEISPKNQYLLNVELSYHGDVCSIGTIKSISKPGRYKYSSRILPRKKSQYNFLILSTSKGVMSCVEARRLGIGGKVLMEVGHV